MTKTEMGIRASLIDQAISCEALGSPFTARLCRSLSARLDAGSIVGQHVFNWQGDYTAKADNVALRLCGAINHLALTTTDRNLAEVYPPNGNLANESDQYIWDVISSALDNNSDDVIRFLASAPQTNEIRRSAVLIAAYRAIAARFNLPIALHELGASAGLNLYPDQYGLETPQFSMNKNSALVLTPQWRGELPITSSLEIIERSACDVAPIDIFQAENCTRMLAYIWPDQADRVSRTKAAIALAQGNRNHKVEQADAIAWLESVLKTALARRPDNCAAVFHHTIAWQYFPTDLQRKGDALFEEYGRKADVSNPIARISMESDGGGVEAGAKLTLTLWPDGTRHDIGRADFHGRWVDWINPVWPVLGS